MDKLLRYDHNDRLTAKEAMDHPYFCKEFSNLIFLLNYFLFLFKDPIVRDQGRPLNANSQVLISNTGKLDLFD